MLEPLTLSAIVFMGAEKALKKLRGKVRLSTGAAGDAESDEERGRAEDRQGGGQGGGQGVHLRTGAAGGEDVVPRPGRIGSASEQVTRGAKLMTKRASQKHQRAVKPVTDLITEDPVAGTATLVQMGKHKIAQHLSHGDQEDILEEQLQEDLMEMVLDKVDALLHLDPKALIRVFDAVQPLVSKVAHISPHSQQVSHAHLSAFLHDTLLHLQSTLGYAGGGVAFVGLLVGLGLAGAAAIDADLSPEELGKQLRRLDSVGLSEVLERLKQLEGLSDE